MSILLYKLLVMKTLTRIFFIGIAIVFCIPFSNAQNVGIGITTPLQKLHVDGTARLNSLAGVGNRMVIANANGDLSIQAIPTAGPLNSLTNVNASPTTGQALIWNGSQWVAATLGDIFGITAGAGLSGGGTTGTPTLNASANNGINVDAAADRIQWGGALTETTTITQGLYSTIFNLTSSGDFLIRDNGTNRFGVLDNGRTTVGGTASAGMFNVTGNSFFSDDIWLRDGGVNGGDYLVRLFDSADDGVIDIYRNNAVTNRLHGNGSSFINGGNLGLGTTTPAQKLHVVGTGRFSTLAGTGNRMVIADADGDLATQAIPTGDISGITAGAGLTGGGTTGSPTIAASANNGLNVDFAADRIQWGGTLTENTLIKLDAYSSTFDLSSTGDFMISASGVNRFSVQDNGRTTVGGTANAGMFNVTGNSYMSDDIWLRDGAVNTGDILMRMYDSSDDGVLDVYQNNAVTNRIHGNGRSFITGGDFGLGVTVPSSPLHIVSNASKISGAEIDFRSTQSSHQALELSNTSVSANERMYGLRTESISYSPNLPFLSSAILAYTTGQGARKTGISLYADCTGGTSYTYGIFADLQNEASGSGAEYAGYFSGNVYTTGSYLPSFRALKQNIQLASPAISKLMELKVKSYEYRTEEFERMNLPQGTQTGFMADEIKAVYPGLVTKAIQPAEDHNLEGKDIEFEAVNYTGLIPDLVKGTQEQQIEIENLKSEIVLLKGQVQEIDKLKSEMEEMKSIIQSLKKD